jgi:AraC-like DNA-binding protein
MHTTIINIQNPLLKDFIQSYIFFNINGLQPVEYTTFPNTNLCLALYKNNQINYLRDEYNNQCSITHSRECFQSRLYAFHQMPFEVNINAGVDQVCILFYPGALRAITGEAYQSILDSDDAFKAIFPKSGDFLSRLFDEENIFQRVFLIENLLLKKLTRKPNAKITESLFLITASEKNELKVEQLANEMMMNTSTLYRLFISELGISPKNFLQTWRFRYALDHLISARYINLNQVANENNYYDLSHFTKEIKSLSGKSPKILKKEISVEQSQLAWIYYGEK